MTNTETSAPMSASELDAAIDHLFGGNRALAAAHLEIPKRTLFAYLSNGSSARRISPKLASEVRTYLEMFPDGVKAIKPGVVIRKLSEVMADPNLSRATAANHIVSEAIQHACELSDPHDVILMVEMMASVLKSQHKATGKLTGKTKLRLAVSNSE